MANLTSAQTGITGTIFISTAMGSHGSRVKYFERAGRTQPSFSVSIADTPTVVANSLPVRTLRQMAPQVLEWVLRNKDELLDFWDRGDTWTQPEVNEFIQRLRSINYDLLAAHNGCTNNRQALLEAGRGACFYCCEEFAADDISEWVDHDSTALCPRCGIDSVLSASGQAADKQFLRRMHEHWFGRTVRL